MAFWGLESKKMKSICHKSSTFPPSKRYSSKLQMWCRATTPVVWNRRSTSFTQDTESWSTQHKPLAYALTMIDPVNGGSLSRESSKSLPEQMEATSSQCWIAVAKGGWRKTIVSESRKKPILKEKGISFWRSDARQIALLMQTLISPSNTSSSSKVWQSQRLENSKCQEEFRSGPR